MWLLTVIAEVLDYIFIFVFFRYMKYLLVMVSDQNTEFSKGRSIRGCAEERLASVDVIIFTFVLPQVDIIIHSHYQETESVI